MERELLEHQADRIEMVLAGHNIPVRVYGGTLTPHAIRFLLLAPLGTKLAQIAPLARDVALALDSEDCRIATWRGALQLEVPRTDAQPLRLLPLCRKLRGHIPPCSALLGLDGGGTPLLVHLSSPEEAHMLVAGAAGSGKTALLRSVATSLALSNSPHRVQLALIHPKGRGLRPLTRLPHLRWPPAQDRRDALNLLGQVVREMERRHRMARSHSAGTSTRTQLVLVADDVAEVVHQAREAGAESLAQVVQRGREVGVHVIASAQTPTSSRLGGLMKANFPVRLVGKVTSEQDALLAAGVEGTGAERLGGHGIFLMVAQGQVTKLQVAYISEEELAGLGERALTHSQPESLSPLQSGVRRLRLLK